MVVGRRRRVRRCRRRGTDVRLPPDCPYLARVAVTGAYVMLQVEKPKTAADSSPHMNGNGKTKDTMKCRLQKCNDETKCDDEFWHKGYSKTRAAISRDAIDELFACDWSIWLTDPREI